MSTALSRQANRWWEFRKWQIDNRGPAIEDNEFCAYLTSQKRRHSISGSQAMISNSSYESTIKRIWTMKLKFFKISSSAKFSEYEEAVKKRFIFHSFTQVFRLKIDPNRQKIRDTWIEYSNFEYWETNRLVSSLKILEFRYRNAWKNLQRYDTLHYSPREGTITFCSKISFTNTSSFEQRLITTQAKIENLWQKIHCLCQHIALYHLKAEALRRQNIRTEWVREQLHQIETEMKIAQTSKITNKDSA